MTQTSIVKEVKKVEGVTTLKKEEAYDTKTKFVPVSVMLNLPISNKTKQLLDKMKVHHVVRSEQKQEQLIADHVAEATVIGVEPYRADRFDQPGYCQADSGHPIYGWGGKEGNISLSQIVTDLVNMGYIMTDIHTMKKAGSFNSSLRVMFKKNIESTSVRTDVKSEIDKQLARFFQRLYVYRNPNGSVTFNPTSAVDPNQPIPADQRVQVRVDKDGAIRSERV